MHVREIVTGIEPEPQSARTIARRFRELARLVPILPAGEARDDPNVLLERGYIPRFELRLFDLVIYLTARRFDDDIGFFVAYVGPVGPRGVKRLYPRIFYKDSSLVWRVATHFIRDEEENWIGKGDLKPLIENGLEVWATAEETTNLPFEIQAALDTLSRRAPRPKRNVRAVPLVLQRACGKRLRPFADFTGPRRRAEARGRINAGRRIARFRRAGDPESLVFTKGFEPDFEHGVIERANSASNIYGGAITKYRVLSANRLIQYQFVASQKQVWANPPQALTRELSTFGVRTLDVLADEDFFIPGYEFHYMDETEDPPQLHTQIPSGFAGVPSEVDPTRADASPWIERMPVIIEFRRKVLGRRT